VDARNPFCGPFDSLTDPVTSGPVGLPGLGPCLLVRAVPTGQCSYACVYCCRGGTVRMRLRRRPFHPTLDLESDVRQRLEACPLSVPPPRYIAFLPGGEPTLDSHLGARIRRLSRRGFRVVVWTNASLLWQEDVRAALLAADRVMIKLDTVDANTWRLINRPARQLRLRRILAGVESFRAEYHGPLDTETTLVPGINDSESHMRAIASFLETIRPACSFINVRPPGSRRERSGSRRSRRTARLAP
jgi:wyosine [tRNA(Phe)-imidazoG37] synthetase (radical SAM superfamily)